MTRVFWWIEYVVNDCVTESRGGLLLRGGHQGFILVEADSMLEAITIAQDHLEAPARIARAKLAEDVDNVILKECPQQD